MKEKKKTGPRYYGDPKPPRPGHSGASSNVSDATDSWFEPIKGKGSPSGVKKVITGGEKVVTGGDPFTHFELGQGAEPQASWHIKLAVGLIEFPSKCWSSTVHCMCDSDTAAFLWGTLISISWFFCMWYIYSQSNKVTIIICSVLGFLLPLAMGLSRKFRACVFLLLCGITGRYGRMMLFVVAYTMTMNGPVVNYTNNIRIFQDTMACAKEQAHKTSMEQLSRMSDTENGVFGALNRLHKNVKKMCANIKMLYNSLLDCLIWMHEKIEKVSDFLAKFRNLCKKLTSIPYNLCCDYFVILESLLCKHFKKMDYPCRAFTKLKNYIKKKIANKMISQFDRTKAKLWEMNMTTVHQMVLNKTITKSHKLIKKQIKADMMWYIQLIDKIVLSKDVLYFILLLIAILSAKSYHKKFMRLIEHDNNFLTTTLMEIDEKNYLTRKPTLFPLKGREKRRYRRTNRLCPTGSECARIIAMTILTSFVAANIGYLILMDYSLFSTLDLVFNLTTKHLVLPEAPSSNIAVSGKGGLASFYRELAGELNKFDTTAAPPSTSNACMPRPLPPDYGVYKTIGYLILCVYLCIILDVYLRRMRHVVMGHFYPKRAKIRGRWLYNRIARLRANYKNRKRRRIQKFKQKLAMKARTCLRTAFRFCPSLKICVALCGFDVIFCYACRLMFREKETKKYKKCESTGCPGIYCVECFSDLDNVCAICTQPADYGDMSDVDEEVDSSGEEGLPLSKMKAVLQSRFPDMFDAYANRTRWPLEMMEMGFTQNL